MKNKYLIVFVSLMLIAALVLVSFLILQSNGVNTPSKNDVPSVFVGIDVAYNNISDVEALVDQVSSYVNLIIVGSTGITYSNQINEVLQHIYDKGLYFIIYTETAPSPTWLQNSINKWSTHFLGLYGYDEMGGKQVDYYTDDFMLIRQGQAANFTDAANKYENVLNATLGGLTRYFNASTNVPLFTSDYAAYWFDYKGGYDTVFAEFGWNYSRPINVALCRGAAESQNKAWGAIMAYTYNDTPYLESAPELYNDMLYAYNNGAKYIVVYDSNPNWTQGILDSDHLAAMQQFWTYTKDNPRIDASADTAFVLPHDYAYGFRGPEDKIWGLWGPDDLTISIATQLSNLLDQHGADGYEHLNVVYDEEGINYLSQYSEVIFWNGTVLRR
ncbi:MAG TPA: hypothetical protein VK253_06980 [Candidatus Binatia bacterium]|nr:hypothetical protein [Candidatus Binatia bacterium]